MANVVINGVAILHGIANNGSAITITGYATFLLTRLEAEHMFEMYATKDSLGNDASLTAFNEHSELTIDFTPDGATLAAAQAIPVYPIPLAQVTLANCAVAGEFDSSSAAIFNGDHVYVGGTRITQENVTSGKISGIKIRRYADTTQNASLTTGVS